jgi:ubiquinone/menaquinone biosynthesis C-methylase UbiE
MHKDSKMKTDSLPPIMYWASTDLALQKAREGMDIRAINESGSIQNGETLEEAHEQAVRDFWDIEQLINGAFQYLEESGIFVSGNAIDMGSGTGVGAAILSKKSSLNQIYALEISEQFVTQIMPKIFIKFNAEMSKIQRVVGDFNKIQLPDESIDLIFDLDSFHHSEDLNFTLKECFRILKPNGVILMIDRGWDDRVSVNYLKMMLDKELNPKLKQKYNIPQDKKFTRRDWGEHEYRLLDWENYFTNNGFKLEIFSQKHPPFLNSILLKTPTFEWTIKRSSIQSRRGKNRHSIYGFNKNRRLMIAKK